MAIFKVAAIDVVEITYEVYVEAQSEDHAHQIVEDLNDEIGAKREGKWKQITRDLYDGQVLKVMPAAAVPEDMELFNR